MEDNCSNCTTEAPLNAPSPLLVLPVLLALVWAIYELFLAPKVLAFFITRIANCFLTDSGIKIRAVRIHLLTGRVLFKNVCYYNRDYSLRVASGYLSARWWWQCGRNVCRSCGQSSGKRAPLLHLMLNGLEWHWYDRSEVYDQWGIEKGETSAEELMVPDDSGFMRWWNSLHPSVHLSIRKGRIILGNRKVEQSLAIYFAKSEAHYSVEKPSNQFDEKMHVARFDAHTVRVVLEPSKGYKGTVTEERPPVLCEGRNDAYLVLRTDDAVVTYYLDDPGIVPLGDCPPPKFAFDVKLGSNSVVNYSCYGNRQRLLLQSYFFPNDHTEKPFTLLPEPGQKRIYTMFDVNVEATSRLTFYQYFTDHLKKPAHLAIVVSAGSNVAIHQPWVYSREGQVSVVEGSLRNVQVSSSLDYSVLGSADTLDFKTDLHFPRQWNATQIWDMRFTGDTVQANILFAYVDFVNDLLDDWLGDEPAERASFVPVDWSITIDLTRYEIFLFTNRYNWVDVALDSAENTRLAFCGTSGQLTFKFPFTEFNPPEQKVLFKAVGENIVVRRYVPPSCSTKPSLFALSCLNKHRWRTMSMPGEQLPLWEGQLPPHHTPTPQPTLCVEVTSPGATHVISAPIMGDLPSPTRLSSFRPPSNLGHASPFKATTPIKTHHTSLENFQTQDELPDNEFIPMGYRGVTNYKDGWLDFASGPSISINIDYTSHAHDPKPGVCTKLHPNILKIDVEAPVVLFRVFGCIARDLLALKENYPGEYINFKTFNSNIPTPQEVPEVPKPPHLGSAPPPSPPEGANEPDHRTMWVYVDFRLKSITAEFPTHLPAGWPKDFPLPSLCTDQLRVAVEYTNRETLVRLDVEPVTVHIPTRVPDSLRKSGDPIASNDLGHVTVSGLSVQAHGFTELLCKERVEYAWLMRFSIQRITGSVSTLQVATALDWFLTAFVHTASFGDGCRVAPDAELVEPVIEPLSEEIKYKLMDVSIMEGDLTISDGDVLTRIQTPGFDLGFCNLHSNSETLGMSFQLHGGTITTYTPLDKGSMVESGLIELGPVSGDLSLREPLDCIPERQLEFLRLADKATRRLWFIWKNDPNCGCWGACMFLEGSINRPVARGKKESAVYNSRVVTEEAAVLESLLVGQCIRDIECVQTIHKGLLEHYHQKYLIPASEQGLRPYSYMSDEEDSFKSARSSFASLTLEESEFKSLEALPTLSYVKQKSKPGILKLESIETGDILDSYKDINNTHTLSDVRLRVDIDPAIPEEEGSLRPHASIKRYHSDGAALTGSKAVKREFLSMRLPQLSSVSSGQLPVLTARRAPRTKSGTQPRRQRNEGLAMFSLRVVIGGQPRILLTPMASKMVENLVDSAHHWFKSRSHLAVMDALSHSTISSIRDHYTALASPSTQTPHPLLHLSIAMDSSSSLALQLLQTPKKTTRFQTSSSLKEITQHMTLMNVYATGLNFHVLFQSSTDVSEGNKRVLSSMDVLGDFELPVLQASLCCLVPQSVDCKCFPNVRTEQSQLSFQLISPRDASVQVCTLLEAGVNDVGVSLVAKILQSEVHEEALLDWRTVHLHKSTPQTLESSLETRNHQFVVDVVFPVLWSQAVATNTGYADPSTGGLDLLVLYESVQAWYDHVRPLPVVIDKLVNEKSSRDKMVLVTLLANAARNTILFKKSFNPVHSDITLSLRQSVVFSCLQQIWQTLPAFSDILAPRKASESFDKELVALLVSISARLCAQYEEAEKKCHINEQNVRHETGSLGYESISPSPSELAIPNALLSDWIDLRDIDYDPILSKANQSVLLALRESMLPLLNETSAKVPPLLQQYIHNKALYLGEVSVVINEARVLVPPLSKEDDYRNVPVFLARGISVRGSLNYATESSPPQPNLALLPKIAPKSLPQSKINISSSCIISIEEISLTLTTPLLKLGCHMMETARYRNHMIRLAEISREDNMTTPRPGEAPPAIVPEPPPIQPTEVELFTQSLLAVFNTLEPSGDNTPSSPPTTVNSPQSSKPFPTTSEHTKRHYRHVSITSSVNSEEIAISMEDHRGHEVLSDTVEYDTQEDSLNMSSLQSSKHFSPRSSASIPRKLDLKDHANNVKKSLSLTSSQLLFSVFGLLKIKHVQAGVQVKTTKASIKFDSVSGSIDVRKAAKELDHLLPTYLSVAATLPRSSLVLTDRGIPDNQVLSLRAQPVYLSAGLCGGVDVPTYRCLMKVCGLELNVPQSPVIIHRRYQDLMPALTTIYQDVFGNNQQRQPTTPSGPVVNMADVKLPPKLPQGFLHFSIDEATVILSPLPSLTVTYNVAPVVAQVESSNLIQFELSVGDHLVKFSPRGPHKDDLTLRSLPHLSLRGTIQGSRRTMIPSVRLELAVKQVEIHITTDVLNQLLVLQNSFIKEVNDLIGMFSSLGESMPSKRATKPQPESDDGLEVLSFLDSCHLSLAGISLTISTPLSTALRFFTGKIDMQLANASANNSSATLQRDSMTRSRFNVMGRVDIDINAALGVLQDSPDDELRELAYFKMRVSLRNTVQNLAGGEEAQSPVVVDTFSISIQNPHLYIQSSAVEQGILFWLNCKSVYNYWHNERKQLNADVLAATEALMEKIQSRPTQLQTPSIDFSKPRLVKLTVSDVGVCMPLTAVSTTPLSSKSQSFPALVITIKEMQFQLNLSHKIASTGNFETFCVRFAEQFYLRQKTWTLDPRKHKFTNCGSIHHGTFRLCVANQKRVSEVNPKVSVGEKLLWAFQWDMSGIDVNANTDIGRHTSAIVRTITTIGTDLDGSKVSRSGSGVSGGHRSSRRPGGGGGTPHVRRSKSVIHQRDESYILSLEDDLARQSRKLQKLKSQDAGADVIQREKEHLKLLQDDLARAMHRNLRQPRGGVGRWFTSPRPPGEAGETGGPSVTQRISQVVRKQLFPLQKDGEAGVEHSPRRRTKSLSQAPPYRRMRSDVSGSRLVGSPRASWYMSSSSSPTPSPGGTPTRQEDLFYIEDIDYEEEAGMAREEEGFTLPTIDVEVDVTINVDYGTVVLRTEESSNTMERKTSLPVLTQSPYLKSRLKSTDSHSYSTSFVDTVIYIPALTVKGHYQSIVGGSYSNAPIPISRSPSPSPSSTLDQLPIKKGVLSISAVVASLPEPLTLTPSLLEFIEKVARPTIAATIGSTSSSSTDSEEEGTVEQAPSSDNWPLSFPVDVTLAFQIQPSTMHLTCQPHSRVECVIQSPDVNFVISFSLFTPQYHESDQTSPVGSGSGLRGNSDKILMFNNLYITGILTTFALQLSTPPVPGSKVSGGSGLDKKEALSLNLGQALIHFSRKSVFSPLLSGSARSVDDYTPSSKLQVSVVMDIASVVGGYDMRRLNDITAFRRYWYRTSLIEALFIGTKKNSSKEEPSAAKTAPAKAPGSEDNNNDTISAVIVVAAKVEDFRVSANFAQVMGNADLLVTQLRLAAHCDVQHNELVLLEADGRLDRGELDARGGVIAGNVLMIGAETHVTTHSVSGSVPVHKCSAAIKLIEARIDYMSACIILARASSLQLCLSDSWEGLQLDPSGRVPQLASVKILANFSWEKLQLSIHRSTTKSMFNMVQKMYEFVMQQKRRSERTISLMLPAGSAASRALHAYREEQKRNAQADEAKDKGFLRHHWLWAMRAGSMELMRTMGFHAPPSGSLTVSLGATMTVSGNNFCLVCFHGPSFRETEWAVFNIDTLNASFSTQAIPGLGEAQLTELTESGADVLPGKQVRTCQQIVNLTLGSESWEKTENLDALAAIYRVSAGHTRPPSIAGHSTENWLNYACIDSYIHPDEYKGNTSTLVRLSKKLTVHSVLLIPAFTVELLNDHFWPQSEGMVDQENQLTPLVECSLTSSFARGISVTTNVDHYLFLHDLVKAYIDYLEKHKTTPSLDPAPESTDAPAKPSPKSSPFSRSFECVCWELDPHLCLLSSAGTGQFNPHVSWLLERLGFEQARTTIPKWIQRVAMDPLDMVVANSVELLIKITATKKLENLSRASSPPPF